MKDDLRQRIDSLVQAMLPSVLKSMVPHLETIDANPKGIEAVVQAAMFRAAADLIEAGFQEAEGEKLGPLKTAVDEIRARVFHILQQAQRNGGR